MAEEIKSEETTDTHHSEKAGVFNFAREMVSALLMAFIAIVYVIQAFKIPTGSMKDSLLIGDFLLGIKFIYGAPVFPFSYAKFPGITSPKQGDVVIFKYPGADPKDYIKRCVAGPGQTIEIKGKNVFIDDKKIFLPPQGKHSRGGKLDERVAYFKKYRIPARGDTLHIDALDTREFLYCRNLIHQENRVKSFSARCETTPFLGRLFRSGKWNTRVEMKFPVFINNTYSFNAQITNTIDLWTHLDFKVKNEIESLRAEYPNSKIEICTYIYLDGKKIDKYVVKNDNYFMMGDNRDNSADSRFWGCLNKNYVKAKAFILYFSWAKNYEGKYGQRIVRYPDTRLPVKKGDNPERLNGILAYISNSQITTYWNERGELIAKIPQPIPLYLFPLKIRWNRIGKLIRGWDGLG